ncbi:hypothetical protein PV392_27600 [Streptomyces sp. ME03-5709C]|nr:hypothetical protein [Streptomyces sp. ME03-5709C]
MTRYLAAPGIAGGQLLGSITLSGLAFAAGFALLLGIRGSDRIKINTRDKAAWWGITVGTLFQAAGGQWADTARGISSVPTSLITDSGMGSPGLGGIALLLALATFGPRWKRTLWPALLGISAAVAFAQAGGVFGILVNIIRMLAAKVTGGL